MHWKNIANYDYLGAYSLEGSPNNLLLTIKTIKQEKVTSENGKSEMCIVACFEETQVGKVIVKPMILNKTNCKTIEKVYGSGEIENWIGKKIIVYATETRLGRDMVPCLRVKNEKPVLACSVCGKEIEDKIYNASIAKYGTPVCSKECVEKLNNNEGKE
jgi:hypothetical protein